ncbi:DUF421 domain-containing protein [Granulicella cerasi]|uniref:DUF421 domain-containing protein n=1 Tax=Granulicella cerasi TaxID=741063 RepID=A0ABW1Z6C9_9BACT|nr:YetF domain-containing protein [Granulicella cerasi]
MSNMFHLPIPVVEKLARPVIMYIVLVGFLRIFGKRELAQLNPFDLVVLLCLSNTVQNAIIGDDNSVTGGIIGAVGLLGINWLLSKAIFRSPRLTSALEGDRTILIKDGRVDEKALQAEALTHRDLTSVLNRNGFNSPSDVSECALEPNGTFFVQGKSPSPIESRETGLQESVDQLTRQVAELRKLLEAR